MGADLRGEQSRTRIRIGGNNALFSMLWLKSAKSG